VVETVCETTERLLDLFLALDAAQGEERERLIDEYERTCRDWVRDQPV
jgi:hypothetical protein